MVVLRTLRLLFLQPFFLDGFDKGVAVKQQNGKHSHENAHYQKTVGNVENRWEKVEGNEIPYLSAKKHSLCCFDESTVNCVANCSANDKSKTKLATNATCATAPQKVGEKWNTHQRDDEENDVCAVLRAKPKGCAFVQNGSKTQKFAQNFHAVAFLTLQQITKNKNFGKLVQNHGHGNNNCVEQNKLSCRKCLFCHRKQSLLVFESENVIGRRSGEKLA